MGCVFDAGGEVPGFGSTASCGQEVEGGDSYENKGYDRKTGHSQRGKECGSKKGPAKPASVQKPEALGCSPFVPGLGESTSDLTSPQAESLARSVSWRGKLMRPQFWSRAWRTYPWLRLLSGATSPLSTVQSGVESWILSLRATRASRSPSPGDVVEWMTPGTSGPTSLGSSERQERLSFSLRTSSAIFLSGSTRSASNLREWDTQLRQAYSARLKSGPHKNASDCSLWPTPVASDDGKKVTVASLQPGLIGAAHEWACGPQVRTLVGTTPPNKYGRWRLNPGFAEALMGFPQGWTGSGPSATLFARWLRLMRSELSRLPWLDA